MASWLPSDSSSDSSSSDSSSDSGVVLARQPVIARAKGTPKGKVVLDCAVAQASGDQPLEKDMLADLVRPVGDELSVELGRFAVRMPRATWNMRWHARPGHAAVGRRILLRAIGTPRFAWARTRPFVCQLTRQIWQGS